MILAAALPIGIVALAVLVPLGREYADLRREWGLSPLAALLAAGTLFPALGVGLVVGLPLAETPALQWCVTVIVTIAVYSLASSVLRPTLASSALRRQP
jgi:hypothetical protein